MRKSHTLPPLPSLKAIRAFEAAARLGSFTATSQELHVTQGAISRQVQELEDVVGHALFLRSGPRLTLTVRGTRLARHCRDILARLNEAVAEARYTPSAAVITFSMLPSVASRWLAPRLEAFHEAFPDIDLRVTASRHLVDFHSEGVDASIRYGRGNWANVDATFIGAESVRPVCSPDYAAKLAFKAPKDLLHACLLHGDIEEGWAEWFRAAGVRLPKPLRGPQLSDDTATLKAVLDGQGVGLGRSLLVADDRAAGRLVPLFETILPTSFGYWFVVPKGLGETPFPKAVQQWLVEGMRGCMLTGIY